MILSGTPILLASGKTKPVEKLRRGDVLRAHTGGEAVLEALIPLRSKKNILVVLGPHFLAMHHDQPVLTTYGWMRPRMLRIGDHLATFHQSGGGSAALLWGCDQRDWEGRLAKVDFRTLNVPPWPSPTIGKVARRAVVSRAHVREILPESYRKWRPIVERWSSLRAEETQRREQAQRAHDRADDRWRRERDKWDRAHDGGQTPFPKARPELKLPSQTTIGQFLRAQGLGGYDDNYFSNWCAKIRTMENTGGSSQPGFDLLCGGGFVVPVSGSRTPLFIICRDGTKYAKVAPAQDDEDDFDDEEGDSDTPDLAAAASPRASKARPIVSGVPVLSRITCPSPHAPAVKSSPRVSASASAARLSASYSRQSQATT